VEKTKSLQRDRTWVCAAKKWQISCEMAQQLSACSKHFPKANRNSKSSFV